MKRKNFISHLNGVSEKYINEADPTRAELKRKNVKVWRVLIAACLCLAVLISGTVLMVALMRADDNKIIWGDNGQSGNPDKDKYDGEYAQLMQKLDEYKSKFEISKNNAPSMGGVTTEDDAFSPPVDPSAPGNNTSGVQNPEAGEDNNNEITDNQVDGVTEADRIKRTDTHIFYMYSDKIEVFSIQKENSKKVGEYTLDLDGYNTANREFYLSDDGKTITLIANCGTYGTGVRVEIISLDVSDPENIAKIKSVSIMGSVISSRLTDNTLLVISEYDFNIEDVDFSNEKTFVPQIDNGNGMESLPGADIYLPESISSSRYTVVTKLDAENLELKDSKAFLSYTEDVYVTGESIYLFNVYSYIKPITDSSGKGAYAERNSMTKILGLSYSGEKMTEKGTAVVRGYVKDRYSLDEYNGILRVVTTTNATKVNIEYADSWGSLQTATGKSNASLYCIDLSTWQIAASVEDFAPPYEEVQSVRFDKDAAYVCTSIEISDPVFFFDLSDINNITFKDTGTIEGFSTSLVNFGDGYLLGIGVGDSRSTFKAEIYRESDTGVVSVAKYQIEYARYSEDYKSYYIDRENKIIGLGIDLYGNTYGQNYVVLGFDGYNILELARVPLNGEATFMRGVLIDGYYYMFGDNCFAVKQLF